MRIEAHPLRDFLGLEQAWRLLERGPDMTAFQSFEWYTAVVANARRERLSRWTLRDRIYVVRDGAGDTILMAPLRMHLLPLARQHQRGIHFSGRTGSADYLNFIYHDFSPEAVELVLRTARQDFRTKRIVLERVLADTALYKWLDGHDFKKEDSSAVAVRVPKGSEAYTAALSKRARQNIRTARNRTRKDELTVRVTFGGNPSEETSVRFAQLKAERSAVRDRRGIQSLPARTQQLVKKWYLRSMFNSDNEATAVMSTHPLAWHMMIEIDGELAAYAFGFREPWRRDPHLRISQVAFNSAFARYSPGMLGLHELLTTLADDTSRPIEVVDFTRGEEPYKFALGGETHTYATFTRR